MKTILILVLLSFQVFAANESVRGSGYATGFCRGDGFGNYCMNQLVDRAQDDATRNADMQCRMKQGTLLSYTRSCYTNCSPPYLQPNQDTYVNCNSDCRYECQLPAKP